MSMFKNFGTLTESQIQLFQSLYEKNFLLPYNAAKRITKNRNTAEDIAQEVFEIAFAQPEAFTDEKHFARWLVVTAKHKAYDHLKNSRRQLLVDAVYEKNSADYRPEHNPEFWYLKNEERSMLLQHIDSLNPDYSMVLYDRFYQGMTYREIAEKRRINENLLRTRCSRALCRLKERVEGRGRRENE